MNALQKGLRSFYKTEEAIIGLLIIAATAVLFFNVVMRFGFNANASWANELIRYMMIWITFIGMAICFRKGMHVGIDFILNYLSERVTKAVRLTVYLLSILFMAFLGYFGLELVLFSMNTGQITPSLEIAIYWVYLIIPIGCLLSIFHLVTVSIQLLMNKEEPSENNVNEGDSL
ncbi:TRAP transporter small permease [Salibacterium halotolerans]|uniref:C4-dicarboxylate transporter, DctQ subunit n=1 Tax=Salibacterium halotolerans TaxID=1884432 RepID=A0A1I5L2F9_9BACI|nr:TRAP transporter small permease [Salibacterium halotolerans]SFO91026.1 C4-dicarboxylate transporter, DctQ subunit [Salibacterium halotolerans]